MIKLCLHIKWLVFGGLLLHIIIVFFNCWLGASVLLLSSAVKGIRVLLDILWGTLGLADEHHDDDEQRDDGQGEHSDRYWPGKAGHGQCWGGGVKGCFYNVPSKLNQP